MDVLKNKSQKAYDYISRYTSFPYYYHTLDNKYIYGTTSQLKDNVSFILHKVNQSDTLDSIAEYYYGRPDYFWIIADFNRIQDPFINLFESMETIKVPTLSDISFKR